MYLPTRSPRRITHAAVYPMRSRLLLLAAIGTILAVLAIAWRALLPLREVQASQPAASIPSLMLWAWERPDDLRSLDTSGGVAFLAGTIELGSTKAEFRSTPQWHVRPRLQPLRVRQNTYLMAVVRIETHGRAPNAASSTQDAANAIVHLAHWPGVRAVQVDFDAIQSQHGFYRSLLLLLRQKLQAGLPLSITALASWCGNESWLSSLPPGTIDDAVPMLFRMGPAARRIASDLQRDRDFRQPACRASLGLATDERFSRSLLRGQFPDGLDSLNGRRIYIFHTATWTPKSIQTTLAEVHPWHDVYSASR